MIEFGFQMKQDLKNIFFPLRQPTWIETKEKNSVDEKQVVC